MIHWVTVNTSFTVTAGNLRRLGDREIMVSPTIGSFAWRLGLILATLAGLASSSSAGFTIQSLGVLTPTGTSEGTAINASGQVAGSATNAFGNTVAVSTAGSGSFQAIALAQAASSLASSINAGNDVAGTYVDGSRIRHGFYTSSGSIVVINPLTGGTYTQANGINNNGQVVGTGNIGNGTTRAFYLASGSTATIISPLGTGTYNVGNGINNNGTVVGSSETSPGGIVHPFLSTNGGLAVDLLTRNSAGNFSFNTYGMAIANDGNVAGYGDVGRFEHAFYAPANGGPLVDLGVLPGASSSEALALNDQALVVGESGFGSSSPGQPASLGFLWGANYGMVSLNSLISSTDQSNWVLLSATGINDSDQITGVGLLNGVLTGYLLTPIAGESIFAPVGTVPEPPAAALATMGLAIVAAWARFRRGRSGGRAAS
jgi:probable HAF family extracellular repeat protein